MEPTDDPNTNDSAPVQSDTSVQPPAADSDTVAAPTQSDTVPTVAPPVKKSNKNPVRLLLLLLLLILVAGGGYLLYAHFHKSGSVQTQTAAVHNPIQSLRLGTTQASLNKLYPDMDGEAVEFDYNAQIYEGLVQFTNNYSTFKPLLAESWSNPDSSTWVFKLKKNVKFQDGKILKAEDVKHSFDVATKSYVGPYITTTIADVTATDDNTVQIKTKGPDPLLLNKLVYMFIVDDSVKPAAGTGAFMPDPKNPATESTLTLLSFDGYHQGTPTTKQLTYQAFKDDDAVIQAFRDNKLDAASDISLKGKAEVPGSITKTERPAFINAFLGFNSKDPKSPLHDVNVRKAIYESVDANAFIAARSVTGTPAGQLIPKGVPGYDPALTRPARNVEDAKKLLATAGYPKGFTVTFSYLTQIPQAAVDVVTKNLAEVGITVKPDPNEDISAFFDKQAAGKLSFYTDGLQSLLFDASDILTTALVPNNYDDPTLDTLVKQASSEFDPTKRLSILKDVSDRIMSQVWLAPLYDRTETDLLRNNMHLTTGQLISGMGAYLWNAYSD